MKKILVPTDFSENARTAYQYAIGLAEKYKATIDVVHVFTEIDNEMPAMSADSFVLHAERQLREFVTQSIEEDENDGSITLRKVKVNAEVKFGAVVETIVDLSKKDYDLVVMGSVGEGHFLEIVFGSVTTKVAQEAYCPVLVIPKNCRFQGVEKLLYACDFKHKSFKHPALVSEVATFFNAKVDVVYVKLLDDEDNDHTTDLTDMQAVFSVQAPNLKVQTHIIEEKDVFYGLTEFAQEHKTDMVVLITHHYSFIEKVFHSSVTKEMAMYTKLPLWVIKGD
jgi:nucleotide-binding universal stress UspA family protein